MTDRRRTWDWRGFLAEWGALIALALLFAFCAIRSDVFLKPQNLMNILQQNSYVGLIAIGMTFVIILGGIDLSVGSMLALLGVLGIELMNRELARGGSEAGTLMLAAAVMIGGGLLLGLANGLLIAKGRIAPFIATLAGMVGFRALAKTVAESGSTAVSRNPLFESIGSGGIPLTFFNIRVLPYAVIAFFLAAILAHVLLAWTRYGRHVYAVGCNERAARYSAINVDRVKLITYALMGGLVGVAALLEAMRLNSVQSASAGTLYELDAIAAVVIGGTRMTGGAGRIRGTVVGVLLIGVIGNMLTLLNVPSELHGLVKGLVILAAVLVQRNDRAS
jgi:ribose transport system permease protein